jgi:hypothetical protein
MNSLLGCKSNSKTKLFQPLDILATSHIRSNTGLTDIGKGGFSK